MPRKSIGEAAMTGAQRQARYRAARAAGAPSIHPHRPAEPRMKSAGRSQAQRWNDSVAVLVELQDRYAAWLDALPDNQHDSATADALRAIVEFDLAELQAIEPPRGFGRD